MQNDKHHLFDSIVKVGNLTAQTIYETLGYPTVVVWGFVDPSGTTHVAGNKIGFGANPDLKEVDRLCYRIICDGVRRVSDCPPDITK